MTLETTFQAVQLTRYGANANPHNYFIDPDEPLCRPLARTLYEVLFENPTLRIESYYIPAHRRLNQFLRVIPPATHDEEPYHNLLGATLVEALPDQIEISRVRVDMGPIGSTPAPTHRLLTAKSELSSWEQGYIKAGLSPLSKLLEKLTRNTRPYILKVVAQQTDDDELEVAVWLVDCTPPTYWHSAIDQTPSVPETPSFSLQTYFGGSSLKTKIEIPDAYDGKYWSDLVSRHAEVGWYHTRRRFRTGPGSYDIELHRASDEYTLVHNSGIPRESLSKRYDHKHRYNSWLRLDSEQLPAVCGLLAAYYIESPWGHTPDRLGPAVEAEGYYQQV